MRLIGLDARLWHRWRRVNRVLRVMLHTHWSTEAWLQIRVELRRPLALRLPSAIMEDQEG